MRYADTTTTDWEEPDRQDLVGCSLATEIFEQDEYMIGNKRENRRRQNLLDEIVREHIDGNRQSESESKSKSKSKAKTKMRAMFKKFLYGK
jgi:hypothetical protein